MKKLTIEINASAYKKLKNMKARKGYPSFGALIAYLVRMENKRQAEMNQQKKQTV